MTIHNVLLAINVRWWNAEAAYAVNVARGLMEKGINVWMIVNPDSPVHHKAMENRINIITDIFLDSMSPIVHMKNLARLLCLVDQKKIQIINSFKSNGSFLFYLARMLRPGLVYIKTRGEARPPKQHFGNRFLYGEKACDGIITVGNQVKAWVDALLTHTDQKTIVIHYGDSPVPIPAGNSKKKFRDRFNIPKDATVLALLGRTQAVKGHLILLKSLQILNDKTFHLLCLVKDLGEFPDILQQMETFIQQADLENQVTIMGFQDKLEEVMSCIDCGVIPSLQSEVNCRVCVEFLSSGIPVIAFPTGTLPDIVQHKKNGYLCPEKSELALVSAFNWIRNNPNEFKQAGEQAMEDYKRRFTLDTLSTKTLGFYKMCLKFRQKLE